MTPPIALTVHDGHSNLTGLRQKLVTEWLTANRINPSAVASDHPITILTVPYQPPADGEDPWLIQVVMFHQFYFGPDGSREPDYLTGLPVSFRRTVPLIVPFPTFPTDGEGHGQADGQAAQEAPQDVVRDQGQAGVSDRHEGQSDQRSRQGQDPRNESPAEGGSRRGHEAVSEPEEDKRRQEAEVTA